MKYQFPFAGKKIRKYMWHQYLSSAEFAKRVVKVPILIFFFIYMYKKERNKVTLC